MSIAAMVAVREYSNAKGPDYIVHLMIADMLNDDALSAWCSIQTIAVYARVAESTVHKSVKNLIKSGELITIKREGKTNLYAVPILEGEAGYAPEKCRVPESEHKCNHYHTPLSVTRGRKPHPKTGKPVAASAGDDTRGAPHEPLRDIDPSTTYTPVPGAPGGSISRTPGVHVVEGGGARGAPNLLMNPYITTSDRLDARASVRETHPSEKNSHAERRAQTDTPSDGNLALAPAAPPEPTPTPPLPPAPSPIAGRPETGEKKSLWLQTKAYLRAAGVSEALIEGQMMSCHLYEPMPGLYRLYVPKGHDPLIFKSRFETPIQRGLEATLGRGNVIVEFAQ